MRELNARWFIFTIAAYEKLLNPKATSIYILVAYEA